MVLFPIRAQGKPRTERERRRRAPPPPSSVAATGSLRLPGVSVLSFGQVPSPLLSALSEAGLDPEAVPAPSTEGDGTTAELAAALRAGERALTGEGVACALVAGAGDDALGAALAAVKLGVPTAWLAPADAPPDAQVIGRVADITVAATEDAEEAVRRIRSLAGPRLRSA